MQPTKYNQFTRGALFAILASNGDARIAVQDAQGSIVRGILQGIAREDGSGRGFLLNIALDYPNLGRNVTVYVRTTY